MSFYESAYQTFTALFSDKQTSIISHVLFGVFIVFGFFFKFRRQRDLRAEMFSRIDEKRFNQLSEQLDFEGKRSADAEREVDLLTLERDHYRSRVRDLLFMIKQLHWMHDHTPITPWPLKSIEDIEKWAMTSPLESKYSPDLTEKTKDEM